MPIYVYLSVKALRTCLWHGTEDLTFSNYHFDSVFQSQVSTWFLANDWYVRYSSGILLWAFFQWRSGCTACCCNLLSMWLAFHRGAVHICLWTKHLIREKSHLPNGAFRKSEQWLHFRYFWYLTDTELRGKCNLQPDANTMWAPTK